jgi:glutathione S-transferase
MGQIGQHDDSSDRVERCRRMRIFSGPLSMFGAKVEIAAREKGIAFELTMVPFDMKRRYEPKHPEVLRINPKRQVPVVIDDAVEIFDSTQIFEYLEHTRPEPAAPGSCCAIARAVARAQVGRGLLPAHHPIDGALGNTRASHRCQRKGTRIPLLSRN